MEEKSRLTFRISLWRPWLLALTVGTACGFGRGLRRCRGQTRRGAEYPARLRRGCGGIAAANRLGRLGEPLARRSGRDWRPKQLSRLPSSGLVRNRVRRAVVDSRVSVLAGERCQQTLGVLAALVLDRHARTSLSRSAVCSAGKPVAALSGETPGLTRCCSRPLHKVCAACSHPCLFPARTPFHNFRDVPQFLSC